MAAPGAGTLAPGAGAFGRSGGQRRYRLWAAATSVRCVKWLDRYFERLFAKPAPFDCGWCCTDGAHGRHDMCTGSAVRPHREGTLRPAAVTECACALRQHERPGRADAPEATRFPTLAVPRGTPATSDPFAGAVGAEVHPYRHVPLPPIDTPEERRHRRDRRRRIVAVRSVLPAIAVAIALSVVSHQLDGGDREGLTSRSLGGIASGDPAVWTVDLARPPQREARSFTALVSRVGCGDVGGVLAPQVVENDLSVAVIFRVAPPTSGSTGACTVNAPVPYSVPLKAPLGGRTLFDGACDVPPVTTTAACRTAQRWPMNGQR